MDEKAFIERIRRERYKVGDDSSDELKAVLNRALEKLANELYAKDTHFILELLQNADDNKYEDGCTPQIRFEADNKTLVVRNNELGFNRDNVNSLCDAGKSTKKGEKLQGYIGEKGIGFKSVFKISNAPQIHSKGFHFNFKTADEKDALGIVVPHWIDNPPQSYCDVGTTIVLPAKNGFEFDANLFEDVQPELLLFLRRLKSIKIFTKWDKHVREIRRKDSANSISIESKVESENSLFEKSEHYKIAIYQVNVTSVEVKEREDFTNSEIVLAFPVTEEGKPSFKDTKNVFAFLPIRNCGLNFIVQADFLLTSNREDIQFNNPWNSKLLEDIPAAFVQEALPLFKANAELRLGFYGYLKFERLEELFKPVLKNIFSLLSKTECVLTASNSWRVPYDTLIGDKASKELIRDDELTELLGKEFVSKEIHSFSETLHDLGCEDFTIDHMFECLKDEGWVSSHKDDEEWFGKLFVYLSLKVNTEALIDEILNLKIFPLTNGNISSSNENNIFFPLKGELYGFEEDLSILKEGVVPKLDAPHSKRVMEFLNKIGLRRAEPQFIIDDYILKEHGSGKKEVNKVSYIGHIRYIKDNIQAYLAAKSKAPIDQVNEKKKLGSKLLILTINEISFHLAKNTYLGKEYRNINELEKLFSGSTNINFVSGSYLQDQNDQKEMEGWFEFFKCIWVNYLPRLTETRPNSSLLNKRRSSTKQLGGTDYAPSEELLMLFETTDRSKKNHLLRLISGNWKNFYSSYAQATVDGYYYSAWEEKHPSTFIRQLKKFQTPVSKNKWQELQKTYVDNNDTRGYFGNDLPFLEIDLSGNSAFLDVINVTYKISLSAALNRIKDLAEGQAEVPKKDIATLYMVIELNASEKPNEVKQFFNLHPVVYLPKHERHWFKASEVCWREPPGKIISSHYPSLISEYREHKTFFLDVVKIREKLSAEQLIEVLSSLDDEQGDDSDKADAAQKIYLELECHLREAEENNEELPDWVERFSEEPLLWTSKHELRINEDDIFVNDIPSIGDLFIKKEGFSFLAVDHNNIPKLGFFIKANRLDLLSKSIQKHLPSGTIKKPLSEIANLLNDRSRYIARYLYTHHNRHFDRLIEDGRLVQLSTAEVFSVDNLLLQLKLNNEEAKARFYCAVIDDYVVVDEGVCHDPERLYYEVANEIAKTLDLSEATAFINQILVTKSHEIIQLYVKDLKQLPSDAENLLTRKPLFTDEESNQEVSEVVSICLPELGHSKNESASVIPEYTEVMEPSNISPPLIEQVNNNEGADSRDLMNERAHATDLRKHSNEQRLSPSENIPQHSSTDENSQQADHMLSDSPPKSSDGHLKKKDFTSNVSAYGGVEFDDSGHGEDDSSPISNGKSATPQNFSGQRAEHKKIMGTITLKKNKQGHGQGLSYASTERSEHESEDRERSEKNMAISRAAVSVVKMEEEKDGFDPVEKDHNNAGYDIHSTKGIEERFIEVKGTDGPWTEYGVSLSPTQVQFAKVQKEKCWLYVVEHARDKNPKLYKIQNPFEKITHFKFDNGWKSFASPLVERNETQDPKEGHRIFIKRFNQSGVIQKVTMPGNTLCKIKVLLDNGKTVDTLYDPANMSLK